MLREFLKVAKTGDMALGEMKLVEIEGERILLANVDGSYHAVSEVCTHAEALLSEGELYGKVVTCPSHGSEFDVTTGEVLGTPAYEPLDRFQVQLQGDDILVGPRYPG